jgi:hypothetical protein
MQREESHRGDLAAPFGEAVAPVAARRAGTRDRAALRAIASGDAISALLRFVAPKSTRDLTPLLRLPSA